MDGQHPARSTLMGSDMSAQAGITVLLPSSGISLTNQIIAPRSSPPAAGRIPPSYLAASMFPLVSGPDLRDNKDLMSPFVPHHAKAGTVPASIVPSCRECLTT
jgi:hypothetical protein